MNKGITYCKKCGAPIDNKSGKCSGCGKQYFRLQNIFSPKIIIGFLIVINVGLAGCSYFWYSGYNYQIQETDKLSEQLSQKNDSISKLEASNADLEKRLNNMSSRYFSLQTDYNSIKDKANLFDEYVVFTTYTGEKYHSYDCFYIQGHPTYYWLKEEAQAAGYEPCFYCQ